MSIGKKCYIDEIKVTIYNQENSDVSRVTPKDACLLNEVFSERESEPQPPPTRVEAHRSGLVDGPRSRHVRELLEFKRGVRNARRGAPISLHACAQHLQLLRLTFSRLCARACFAEHNDGRAAGDYWAAVFLPAAHMEYAADYDYPAAQDKIQGNPTPGRH